MSYFKSKSTKRFDFTVNRNSTAKKAGSNSVTISTRPESEGYSYGGTQLTMTVREAQALQSFLNDTLTSYPSDTPETV